MDFGAALTDMWRAILLFVPKALGFIAILLVGYLIARLLRRGVKRLLERLGFDRAVRRGGIARWLANSRYDAAEIVAMLAYYTVLLFTLQLAFGIWGPNPVSDLIAAVVAWLPRAIVAIIIVVVAAAVASAVKDVVINALSSLSYGRLLANLAAIFIVGLGVIAALNQIGIATTVTTPVLITVLATIGGILVVGVGGGMIRPMQQRWERWLTKAEDESGTVREKIHAYAETRREEVAAAEAARREMENAPAVGMQSVDTTYAPGKASVGTAPIYPAGAASNAPIYPPAGAASNAPTAPLRASAPNQRNDWSAGAQPERRNDWPTERQPDSPNGVPRESRQDRREGLPAPARPGPEQRDNLPEATATGQPPASELDRLDQMFAAETDREDGREAAMETDRDGGQAVRAGTDSDGAQAVRAETESHGAPAVRAETDRDGAPAVRAETESHGAPAVRAETESDGGQATPAGTDREGGRPQRAGKEQRNGRAAQARPGPASSPVRPGAPKQRPGTDEPTQILRPVNPDEKR